MQTHITKSGTKNSGRGGRDADTEGDAKSRDDWETPSDVVRALACLAYGPNIAFNLDAAASESNAKAPRWFTKTQDGISQKWRGRVFVNPPWSNIRRWLSKAAIETEKKRALQSC